MTDYSGREETRDDPIRDRARIMLESAKQAYHAVGGFAETNPEQAADLRGQYQGLIEATVHMLCASRGMPAHEVNAAASGAVERVYDVLYRDEPMFGIDLLHAAEDWDN